MPNVIDLYAGAGGLSLGAYRAGFNVVAAIEIEKHAMETHRRNFPNTAHIEKDIRTVTIDEIEQASGYHRNEICGVIGGPPCQGFSTIGQGNVEDDRNSLFQRFFEIVSEIKPVFLVAENFPGIMRDKYNTIRKEAFACVNDYVLLEPLLVNASDYGAATSRSRYFFIGINQTCRVTLNSEDFNNAKVAEDYKTKVREALEGLPASLNCNHNQKGVLALNKTYTDKRRKHRQNAFFYSHITGLIPENVGNPGFIKRYKKEGLTNGFLRTVHSDDVTERYKNLKYGEQDKISKSKKLKPDAFCPTLRAGTGPDKGSFQAVRPIHYSEARVINPREAARLQGFPDWFELPDTIWHSFRQIGNSVSPIAAEAILRVLFTRLLG